MDNFTHGLAVSGSFLVSQKVRIEYIMICSANKDYILIFSNITLFHMKFQVGLLTTFAILLHEIPHEVKENY